MTSLPLHILFTLAVTWLLWFEWIKRWKSWDRCRLNIHLILTLAVQTQPPLRLPECETQTLSLSAVFISPQEKHFHYRKRHQQINKLSILQYAQKLNTQNMSTISAQTCCKHFLSVVCSHGATQSKTTPPNNTLFIFFVHNL